MCSFRSTNRRRLGAMLLACSIALLGSSLAPAEADKPETAEQKLLRIVSTETEAVIKRTYGLDFDVVDKIMAYRKSGKTFTSAQEFEAVTGLTSAQVLAIKVPDEVGSGRNEPIPPPPRPAATGGAASKAGTPVVSNVRPGYYGVLPGFDDLDKIDPVLRKEFLERVNNEKCQCGCENETVAFCLVNDPGCPVVKARARKIYEEVLSKAPAEPEE